MLGGIPRKWVHVCIAKRNLLEISEIYAAGPAFTNHLGASSCILNGVVEDRRFLRVVSEAIIVFPGSYLTTFVKRSPPRNGSNYVKTGGVLMPPKWGSGGQEVLEAGF